MPPLTQHQLPVSTPESWLRQQASSVKGPLLAAIGWSLAAGLLIIIQARLLALICQRVVIDSSSLAPLLPLVGWIAGLVLLRGVATWLGEHAAVTAASRVKQQLRSRLYRHLLQLKPGGQAGEVGPLTEVVTSGIEGLEAYIARFLPQMALAGMLPLAMLMVVIPSEWRSSLVLLFSAPFIPLLMVLIGKGTETLNRRQFSLLSRLAGYLLDLVQGLPDLKIFGAARREAELVRQASDQYRSATMGVLRVAFMSAFTLEFFSTVGTAVIAVLIGFRLLDGSLTLLDGLFVLLLAPEFYLPLRTLGLSYHSRMNGIAAAEQIMPLLEQPLPGNAEPVTGAASASPKSPEIICESVTFRYGGQRGGVQDISLTIPAGSMTALVGASGSGKSTLARLLLGLARPEYGQVRVNGSDLAAVDQQSWRAQLAWVPQKPFFFVASIRENLLLGCPQAEQQTIRSALEQVGLLAVIEALPSGLETVLGDQGTGLSGGELRRLALARVLLRDARLVVLDEPTAGLDAVSEQLVLDSLARLAAGRTLLLISHREATIRCCTQVIELVAGRLERVTTPQQYLGEGP